MGVAIGIGYPRKVSWSVGRSKVGNWTQPRKVRHIGLKRCADEKLSYGWWVVECKASEITVVWYHHPSTIIALLFDAGYVGGSECSIILGSTKGWLVTGCSGGQWDICLQSGLMGYMYTWEIGFMIGSLLKVSNIEKAPPVDWFL